MNKNHSRIVRVISAGFGALLSFAASAMSAEPDPRQAELTKTAEAFIEAYHTGDAKAVAAFWAPDGDFVDRDGRVLKGRQAIEHEFTEIFKENKGLKLRIEVSAVRFLNADTVIEDGTTSVLAPDGSTPSRARYTNVLVKKDGKWLLVSVREAPYIPPNNQQHLRGLEWMIGEWVDQATDGHMAHVAFDWTPDNNYIFSMRTVHVGAAILDNGTQRIGWDAAAKQIRAWNFEPDGGFGESVWAKEGDNWVVKSKSTLQSGHKMSATTVVTRVDADTVTWQSKDQQVDGKPIADSPPVTMKRVK